MYEYLMLLKLWRNIGYEWVCETLKFLANIVEEWLSDVIDVLSKHHVCVIWLSDVAEIFNEYCAEIIF